MKGIVRHDGARRRFFGLVVAAAILTLRVLIAYPADAAAPPRPGQPYAETICNTDPNIIFCEDFDYPENFFCGSSVGNNNHRWANPGFVRMLTDFQYCFGRQINPLSQYAAPPAGSPQTGSVWAGNWDATKGTTGSGASWGILWEPSSNGGRYANGTAPVQDVYVRFQVYFTPNWVWPGDPKTDPYGFGSYGPFGCVDNKLMGLFPPGGDQNPTNSAYGPDVYTQCGAYDPSTGGRFADAVTFRVGDNSDNNKNFPLCIGCTTNPQHLEYHYQSLTLRNPNDQPIFGKMFRFNTGRWYTVEWRYKLGTAQGAFNGIIELWIDGTKVYSASDLATCGSGIGNAGSACYGISTLAVYAYHNMNDITKWNGQQIIDNLIISRQYIGPPGGASAPNGPAPTQPSNFQLQ